MTEQYLCCKYVLKKAWVWHLHHAGGEDMFAFTYYDTTYDTSVAFKGFGWESFCNKWLKKLSSLKKDASKFEFSTSISELVDWVQKNNVANDKNVFEKSFKPLSFESRQTLLKVLEKYEEQYDLLISDCFTYDDFWTVITFLQDFPHQIIELMTKYNLEEIALPRAKIPPPERSFQQEKTYDMSKMLESKPTFSYLGRVL